MIKVPLPLFHLPILKRGTILERWGRDRAHVRKALGNQMHEIPELYHHQSILLCFMLELHILIATYVSIVGKYFIRKRACNS